jgi:Ulp1 family protease
VTLLDSLGIDRDLCYQQICDYLKAEAANRLNINPQDFKVPVHLKGRSPIQPNNTDCGVYCLYCIKHLYENPDRIQPALISPQPSNDCFWVPELVTQFRRRLVRIFKNKIEEYGAYKKEQGKNKAEEKVDEE